MGEDWRRSRTRRMWSLARLVRHAGIASISGAAAGLIAGGLASGVAVRITASEPWLLILASMAALGCSLGLGFLAVRPALDSLGKWRGLVFGLVLLGTFGFSIMSAGDREFLRFGSAWPTWVTFTAMFVGYGLLVSPIYNRLDMSVPRLPPDRTIRFPTIAAYAAIGLSALVGVLAIPLAVAFAGPVPAALYALFFLVALVRVMMRRSQITERWGTAMALSPMGQRLQLAVLGLPFIVGTFLTMRSIALMF
ncbi:MAG: hypothetical protein M3164_02715 [Actinomycetota bacterium]|nr:hypothetical protein [Actinomycetota bacterium]